MATAWHHVSVSWTQQEKEPEEARDQQRGSSSCIYRQVRVVNKAEEEVRLDL